MAEVVDSIPGGEFGKPRKYPWSKWLDGQVWKLDRGKDFTCGVPAFRAQVHTAAARAGKVVKTRVTGDAFYIQASDKDDA